MCKIDYITIRLLVCIENINKETITINSILKMRGILCKNVPRKISKHSGLSLIVNSLYYRIILGWQHYPNRSYWKLYSFGIAQLLCSHKPVCINKYNVSFFRLFKSRLFTTIKPRVSSGGIIKHVAYITNH